jgi:hypothetical protein
MILRLPSRGSGGGSGVGSETNALVAVCAEKQFDFHAGTVHVGLLVDGDFRQLRPICPCQWNRAHQFVRRRTGRFQFGPTYLWVVHRLRD